MMKLKFNWFTELDKAINTEPTDDKFFDLERRAFSWVTCACGQLCKKLPRRKGTRGAPEDPDLYANGTTFSQAILGKHWVYAKIVLERIEKRTIKLLNELK